MKNNIDYYEHMVNSHDHWKFKTLRRVYASTFPKLSDPDGWAGEGKFWALNNLIAREEGSQLNLKEEDLLHSISADLGFIFEEFLQYIEILEKRCKLVRKTGDFLTTRRVQVIFQKVTVVREKERMKKIVQRGSTGDNQNVPGDNQNVPRGQSESPRAKQGTLQQSRVEYSREEYSYPKSPSGASGSGKKNDVVGIVKNPDENIENLLKKGARKPAPKKKKESTPDTELFNAIKNYWMVWYKKRVGQPPRFGPKEAGSVSNIRKGLLGICREGSEDPHQEAAAKFNFILENWELLKKSSFLYSCVDITMINSKINEIFNAINSERIIKGRGGFVYDKL